MTLKTKIINHNNIIIIHLIINFIFVLFDLNYIKLYYIENLFYSIGTIIYIKILLRIILGKIRL